MKLSTHTIRVATTGWQRGNNNNPHNIYWRFTGSNPYVDLLVHIYRRNPRSKIGPVSPLCNITREGVGDLAPHNLTPSEALASAHNQLDKELKDLATEQAKLQTYKKALHDLIPLLDQRDRRHTPNSETNPDDSAQGEE
jgi:hypothetical protein